MFTDVACQLLRLGERTEATKRLHTIIHHHHKSTYRVSCDGGDRNTAAENTF